MPMENIIQPEILEIDETLRLRRFDDVFDFALDWYQDKELVKLVDGAEDTYDEDRLSRMYHYLDQHGELYFIEKLVDGKFTPIGDVTLWQTDMPIVISRPYWKQGIGKRTVQRLIRRAKELGWTDLYVDEIYSFNAGSRRLFEGAGFVAYEQTDKGSRFHLKLQ